MLCFECDNEDIMDPMDVNSNGQDIFSLIDAENGRHLRRKEAISAKVNRVFFIYWQKLSHEATVSALLEQEKLKHRQHIMSIWALFGVDYDPERSKPPKLTAKQKHYIRKKVKIWSKTDPQSCCNLARE